MRNNFLINQAREESAVIRFFYDLLNSKCPNWDTATDKERIIYLLKHYVGSSFFSLGNSYHSFISRITAYYPFSLLYKDKLFHHDNLGVLELMSKIEKIAKKEGADILIFIVRVEEEMTELIGYLEEESKNRQEVLGNLETVLQKVYGSVYVRDQGDKFRILIPTELFQELAVTP